MGMPWHGEARHGLSMARCGIGMGPGTGTNTARHGTEQHGSGSGTVWTRHGMTWHGIATAWA